MTNIEFTLRGLDTGVELTTLAKLREKENEDTVYHHYIMRENFDVEQFNNVFWFRNNGKELSKDLIEEELDYAIAPHNWVTNNNILYSQFKPYSGVDSSKNIIAEDASLYYEKDTVAELGVSRLARQLSGTYVSNDIFENKETILQHYANLDGSLNTIIREKLFNGGTFENPLNNTSLDKKNIVRGLLYNLLNSGDHLLINRVFSAINDASGGAYSSIAPSDNNNHWVPINFIAGDKLRHTLSYGVANIVENYTHFNIVDPINGATGEKLPNIVSGGKIHDYHGDFITDQHFVVEYVFT